MSRVNVGNDQVFLSDNILFVPGGRIRNYLAGGRGGGGGEIGGMGRVVI